MTTPAARLVETAKFTDPDWTAKGERRARVPLTRLETLWINTGTLCNITCQSCYIESSPSNDRLSYITLGEAEPFLDEAAQAGAHEIGLTGGEPFLNPETVDIARAAFSRDLSVLILTNAMQPMQRPHVKHELVSLRDEAGARMTIRVSLDHFTPALHERERGANTWARAVEGTDWLSENGFRLAIAGRTCWHETEPQSRAGYARLIAERGWSIDAADPAQVVLLPEMNGRSDVPEITDACWDIVGTSPSRMMCATSRMVVKRRGASDPTVLPCTLLPYDPAFEMGRSLEASTAATGGMFDNGAVKLCHPHCATFCVLGGGSCS